jgi:UDP-N-acetylmuramoyl-tripeptide--D-alanyl-D-alanine ligase
MSMMNVAQIEQWTGGVLYGNASTAVERVHTDTRSLQAGDLFVAIKGERFDAHDFLAEAKNKGAVAAIAHHGLQEAGLPGVEVADSKLALGKIAAAWREQFDLPMIAVAGSNGKTTVTQMIASILRAQVAERAFATQGNLNNDIGVPLTLLRLRAEHRLAVVELGMNHPGEITYLAQLVKPSVALVNNAQREHQEFMHTVEAVARENGAVIAALPASGVAVFPADEEFTPVWRELAGTRSCMTFAMDAPADVTAQAQWYTSAWVVKAQTPAGPVEFSVQVAGRHNVKNALAATACALAAGASLEAVRRGLNAFEPIKGRARAIQILWRGHDLTLIDDSYNANPDSVRAAIDVLAELPAPQLLVLGDMGEVGNQGPQFHAEVGAYAKERGIAQLLATGELSVHATSAFTGGQHTESVEKLIDAVNAQPTQYASILVKGSRFMKMEQVVQALQATDNNAGEATCS